MRRRGFTIVEILMVISIIAILAAILFPVFARAREQARTRSCVMNLTNIALALRAYAHDHDGWYPPTEDDLSPLMPGYLDNAKVFQCPSQAQGLPMGAPADSSWPQPPEQDMMGAPGMEPGMPPPASYAPGVDVQPGQVVFAQDEGAPPGMGVGPPPEEPALTTTYYYRAGRRHNQTPLAPLCSDHKLTHNDRANVLFSDGAVKLLPEGPWRELGFETPEEISQRRAEEQAATTFTPMAPMMGQQTPPPDQMRTLPVPLGSY